MKKIINTMMLVCVILCHYMALSAQSSDMNYIKTQTRTNDDTFITEINYYDGLGRQIQSVLKNQSPQGQDMVTNIVYDHLGRTGDEWLPLVSVGDGAYASDAMLSPSRSQLYNDNFTLKKSFYEASPEGRIIQVRNPGSQWLMKGKTDDTEYHLNDETGKLSCRKFRMNSDDNDLIVLSSSYAEGQLNVIKHLDEDNDESYVFTDWLGQKVLERVVLSDGEYLDTYYVYDNRGNLRAVIPPMAAKAFDNAASDVLEFSEKYVYLYGYDSRNRCIRKKLPGEDWIYYRYDKSDFCIFTQDGESRKSGVWRFSIPDVFGRECVSGVCSNTNIGEISETFVTANFAATGGVGGSGYSIAGITLQNPVIYLIKYYDDYSFLNLPALTGVKDDLIYSARSGCQGKEINVIASKDVSAYGLETGKRVMMLNGSNTEIVTAEYYNARNNPVQSLSVNVSDGVKDRYYRDYTFTGRIKRVLHEQEKGDHAVLEVITYTYDVTERLETISHKFGSCPEVRILKNLYDEVGRLEGQVVNNGRDTVSYAYNLRGWMMSIDSPVFSQKLYYNNGPGNARYDGNISAISWVSGTDIQKGYKFTYDSADRLTSATYGESTSMTINEGGFSESFEYDLNGNVTSLTRKGITGDSEFEVIDCLDVVLDGNLLKSVDDSAVTSGQNAALFFADGVKLETEYTYDLNGNLKRDLNKGITNIEYNLLNLPNAVTFGAGQRTLSYGYDANGEKHSVAHTSSSGTSVTEYCDNVIYRNGSPAILLTEIGYYSFADGRYHTYIRDWQGNNRVVLRDDGLVEELNDYYASGCRIGGADEGVQPYKYSGKELDTFGDLNWYDFGARHYDPVLMRWTTTDPLAEKYYGVSPYAFCNNNPVNFIDPDGAAWGKVIKIGNKIRKAVKAGNKVGVKSILKSEALDFTGNVHTILDSDASGFERGVALFDLATGLGDQAKWLAKTIGVSDGIVDGARVVDGIKFKSFTARNFRDNLMRLTGETPDASKHAHHIFPKGVQEFSETEINPNDPRFGIWLDADLHLGEHRAIEYNNAWKKFFNDNPNPTTNQLFDQARKLMKEIYGTEVF